MIREREEIGKIAEKKQILPETAEENRYKRKRGDVDVDTQR